MTLHYNIEEFTLEETNGITSITTTGKYPFVMSGDTLSPALPYLLVDVLVSPTCSYKGLNIVCDSEVLVSDNVILANTPAEVPTSVFYPRSVAASLGSYKLASYPEQVIEFYSEKEIEGYRCYTFKVCPFRFDVVNRRLYLKTSLDFDIYSAEDRDVPTIQSEWIPRANAKNEMMSIIANPEDMSRLYPLASHSGLPSEVNEEVKYLIVTSRSLGNAFEKLADWKTTKGLKAKILYTEDIYENYSGRNKPEKIRNAIKVYKDAVEYILLGGDVEQVPSLSCYLYNKLANTRETPADIFYASFKSDDWDANGNGIYAEANDNVCVTSEISIGRLSVDCESDALQVVDRLISYEQSPCFSKINQFMLAAGSEIANTYGDGRSDSQVRGETRYEKYISPYWDVKYEELYDTYTSSGLGDDYDLTAQHLQEQLSKGYAFVDFMGHGNISLWRLGNNTYYTSENASLLVNSGYTFITTLACHVNHFDTSPDKLCLGESFIRNHEANILAFVANSREGWYPSGASVFDEIYKCILKDKCSIGDAVRRMKNRFAPTKIQDNDSYSWMTLTLNPQCDPEMRPYCSMPTVFEKASVCYQNGCLTVDAGEDSCRICVSSKSEEEWNFYKVMDNTRQITLSDVPQSFTVCIVKDGHIPFCKHFIYENEVYVQDKTICTDTQINAANVYIGEDVDGKKAKGPVTVSTGTLEVRASNKTHVKNGLKIRKGASMKLQNEQ